MKTSRRNSLFHIIPGNYMEGERGMGAEPHIVSAIALKYILSWCYLYITNNETQTAFSSGEQAILLSIGELWSKHPELKDKRIK